MIGYLVFIHCEARNDPDSSTPSQIGWKGNQLESPELREAWRGPPNLNMVQLQKVTKNPCPLKEFKFVSVSFLCLVAKCELGILNLLSLSLNIGAWFKNLIVHC
ncbi:hypothetical protein NC652_023291 [Populus alba x Populus x berolinensis]|nr:hypothetical protein NC652_023291 [Populus alba x Populus x berolinensis]